MDYSQSLAMSYYKTIATLNEQHNIFLVQHQETNKIYVKKVLDVYNINVYQCLRQNNEELQGIPKLIDYYEKDHQLIIIEEFISGQSLAEYMASSKLTDTFILNCMLDLCHILEKLHTHQPPIVHRDIKPSNIIVTYYHRFVLLDFNAAKFFTESVSNDTVLLGTPGYAAPEQYGFGSSTPLTDIYSLGILLKELVQALPVATSRFDPIIRQCTELNPSDRYQSVAVLKEDLCRLTTGIPRTPYPQVENIPTRNIATWISPGFRTKTPWKMLCAIAGYLMIFNISFTLEVKDKFGAALWYERIFTLLVLLSIVATCFNYRNIQNVLPLHNHHRPIIRAFGVLLGTGAITFALLFIMVMADTLLFH